MIKVGEYLGKGKSKRKILDIVYLSNGWILVKTEDGKSRNDFKVRTITEPKSLKYYTPKHAHFIIDFYGKFCFDREKAYQLFQAVIKMWQGEDIQNLMSEYKDNVNSLPGYSLEYILYALKWIFEQEDINFSGRGEKLQRDLNAKLQSLNVPLLESRRGSQLAISLFCDIINDIHPVEALLSANIDIVPKFKKK